MFRIIVILLVSTVLNAQTPFSLYSDIKARKVGDLVSIIIVETANASRETKSNSSSAADMGVKGSVTGSLTDLVPDLGLSSSYSNSYDGSEGTAQKERLSGRITVRIVEQTKEGLFKLQGERALEVNGEENIMELVGFVRPRDILANNTVMSYNVADAHITYRKGGIVNSVVSPGTLPTIFSGIVGIGLLLIALGWVAL